MVYIHKDAGRWARTARAFVGGADLREQVCVCTVLLVLACIYINMYSIVFIIHMCVCIYIYIGHVAELGEAAAKNGGTGSCRPRS